MTFRCGLKLVHAMADEGHALAPQRQLLPTHVPELLDSSSAATRPTTLLRMVATFTQIC